MFGIQNFVACNWEWMDNVAVNVASYKSFLKNKGNVGVGDKVDNIWRIYDPATDTERAVVMRGSANYCIGRVYFGRYCDCISSKTTSDNSGWNQWYSDRFEYQAQTGRVVGRGGFSANAYCGLVYAHASYASSSSNTVYGSRLAFIGKIEIE